MGVVGEFFFQRITGATAEARSPDPTRGAGPRRRRAHQGGPRPSCQGHASSSPGWDFTCNFEVDYESEEHASIVYKTLAVDKELQPDKLHPDKVRREMTISGGKLIVVFLHEVYDGQLVVRLKKGNNLPAMDPWSDDSDNGDDGSEEVSSSDEEEEGRNLKEEMACWRR